MWLDQFEFEMIAASQKMLELFKDHRFSRTFGLNGRQGINERSRRKITALRRREKIRIGYWGWNFGPQPMSFDVAGRAYLIRECQVNQGDFDIFFADWNRASHNFSEIRQMLEMDDSPLGVVWFVDHHHSFDKTLHMAKDFDLYCCAHAWGVDYLNAAVGRQLVSIPCAATQWRQDMISKYLAASLGATRSDALYGGFKSYSGFTRDDFLRECQEKVVPSNIFFRHHATPTTEDRYFSLTESGRFHEWCSHKTSLVVSVNYDIPMRLFDALLTGQIPLVPDDIIGLEHAITLDQQLSLPLVFYRAGDVGSVVEAQRRALDLFDRDGMEGVRRRANYSLQHHGLAARMERLALALEARLTFHASP